MPMTTTAARIRYACPCGRLAPLGAMFFSELCQKLVCRHPSCSLGEFESYYCGALLVNLPSKEASMYQNRSSRCFACAACDTVLSTVFHETLRKYFFACAHCHWDSLELGLVDDDPDMLLMTAVARERETDQEEIFHTLLSHHASSSSSLSSSGRGRRSGSGAGGAVSMYGRSAAGMRSTGLSRTGSLQQLAESMKEMQREQQMKKFRWQRMAEMGSWKYEHALAHVEERAQWLEQQRHEYTWPELEAQLKRFVPAPELRDADLDELAHQSDMGSVTTLTQRFTMPLEQPRAAERLFPHRPLLRVKRTWRCVESMARGSAGILVKPQISPMSGDSSLPIPASWFKKATLGVHFVPNVTFQSLPKRVPNSNSTTSSSLECVLLVENPLDEAIQIVCRAEALDDDDHGSESTEALQRCVVMLDDFTPIVLGAYEDPTIADAFQESDSSSATAGNRHVVSRVRNLAKIRVPLEVRTTEAGEVSLVKFQLRLEMMKIDEALQEPDQDTVFTFATEFAAPVDISLLAT